MKDKNISSVFINSKFGEVYAKIFLPIFIGNIKKFAQNIIDADLENIDDVFTNLPANTEFDKISYYFRSLLTILEDLELVLIFLRIENDDNQSVFKNNMSDQQYYVYHFENYMIRLVTITDVVGKLGNILYETGIDDDKCNGYNFKEKLKQDFSSRAQIIETLLKRIKEIKARRHKKIHSGRSEIPYLAGTVLYNDMMKALNNDYSPILLNKTRKNLNSEIDRIESEIHEIVDITNQFLDISVDRLKKLLEK